MKTLKAKPGAYSASDCRRALALRAKDPRAYARLAPKARMAAEAYGRAMSECRAAVRQAMSEFGAAARRPMDIVNNLHPNLLALVDTTPEIAALPWYEVANVPEEIAARLPAPKRRRGRPRASDTSRLLAEARKLLDAGMSQRSAARKLYPGMEREAAYHALRRLLSRHKTPPARK